MFSFFNKIFPVTGINNILYSNNTIGNRKFQSKLLITVFQINSISLIESENFGKPHLRSIEELQKS